MLWLLLLLACEEFEFCAAKAAFTAALAASTAACKDGGGGRGGGSKGTVEYLSVVGFVPLLLLGIGWAEHAGRLLSQSDLQTKLKNYAQKLGK